MYWVQVPKPCCSGLVVGASAVLACNSVATLPEQRAGPPENQRTRAAAPSPTGPGTGTNSHDTSFGALPRAVKNACWWGGYQTTALSSLNSSKEAFPMAWRGCQSQRQKRWGLRASSGLPDPGSQLQTPGSQLPAPHGGGDGGGDGDDEDDAVLSS